MSFSCTSELGKPHSQDATFVAVVTAHLQAMIPTFLGSVSFACLWHDSVYGKDCYRWCKVGTSGSVSGGGIELACKYSVIWCQGSPQVHQSGRKKDQLLNVCMCVVCNLIKQMVVLLPTM